MSFGWSNDPWLPCKSGRFEIKGFIWDEEPRSTLRLGKRIFRAFWIRYADPARRSGERETREVFGRRFLRGGMVIKDLRNYIFAKYLILICY